MDKNNKPLTDRQDYTALVDGKEILIEKERSKDKNRERFEKIARELAAKGTRSA